MPANRGFSRLATLAVASVLLMAPGCLKLKSTLVLGKDGSGSVVESFTVDLAKFTEIGEGVKMGAPGMGFEQRIEAAKGGSDVAEIQKRLEGKTCVRLQRVSQTQDFEANTIASEVRLKFTSLAECLGSAPGLASMRNVVISLEQGPEDTWTLTRKLVPGGMDVPETVPPEAQAQVDMAKMMLAEVMADFEMVIELELPGTVVATNGTKNAAGNGVTWKLGFEDVTDPKKLKHTVTFKGEGLTLKPFTLRLDDAGKALDEAPKMPGMPGMPGEAPKDAPKEEPKAPETPKEPAAPTVPK